MKKLATIALSVVVLATGAYADPMLEYTSLDFQVDVNLTTGEPWIAAEAGDPHEMQTWTQYTFSVRGHDGHNLSFAITNLTFTGDIKQDQYNWFGLHHAHTQSDATTANAAPDYNMELDSWLYDGWGSIAPDNSNMPPASGTILPPEIGDPVILSVGSGTSVLVEDKLLVQIVALGPVEWDGVISRNVKNYRTRGMAGARAGQSQHNPIMPDPVQGSDGEWIFDVEPGGSDVVEGGAWYDPPPATEYVYEIIAGDSTFDVVGLPVGINAPADPFFVDGIPVLPGEFHDLDPNVSNFIISGIDPAANLDPDDPAAFPTFLSFDLGDDGEDSVHFTMKGIPEPGTLSLILFGGLGLLARRRHRN